MRGLEERFRPFDLLSWGKAESRAVDSGANRLCVPVARTRCQPWVPVPQMLEVCSRFIFFFINSFQLLLAVCEKSTPIGTSCQGAMLPSITNVINLADSHDRAAFAMVTHVKQEPRERENSESKEEVMLQIADPSRLGGWEGKSNALNPSLPEHSGVVPPFS